MISIVNENKDVMEKQQDILVTQLFSSPVAIMAEEYVLSDQERKVIDELRETGISGGDGGNISSADHYLCDKPALKNLKDYFQRNLNAYAYDVMKIEESVTFYITQSWCNYNRKGTSHHKHWHANSVFSAVYFIDGDDTPIEFYRPIPMNNFYFPIKEYNTWNSESFWLPNQKNRLYIFPSTLVHSVFPNKSETTRMTISFNSFFKGKVGLYEGATELILD